MAKCIICNKNEAGSTEHIIPEFLGGSLTFDEICRDCNSTIGAKIEGPLSNTVLFSATCAVNGVTGRSGKEKHPLSGVHEMADGSGKVRVRFDGKIERLTDIESEQDDDGVSVSIRADADNLEEVKEAIRKRVLRAAADAGRAVEEDEIDAHIEASLENNEDYIYEICNPELVVTDTIHVNEIGLLATKIAFEMGVYHFGREYLSDPAAQALRQSLVDFKAFPECWNFLDADHPHFRVIDACLDPDKRHWVVIADSVCFIQIFTMRFIVRLKDSADDFGASPYEAYFFGYLDGDNDNFDCTELSYYLNTASLIANNRDALFQKFETLGKQGLTDDQIEMIDDSFEHLADTFLSQVRLIHSPQNRPENWE